MYSPSLSLLPVHPHPSFTRFPSNLWSSFRDLLETVGKRWDSRLEARAAALCPGLLADAPFAPFAPFAFFAVGRLAFGDGLACVAERTPSSSTAGCIVAAVLTASKALAGAALLGAPGVALALAAWGPFVRTRWPAEDEGDDDDDDDGDDEEVQVELAGFDWSEGGAISCICAGTVSFGDLPNTAAVDPRPSSLLSLLWSLVKALTLVEAAAGSLGLRIAGHALRCREVDCLRPRGRPFGVGAARDDVCATLAAGLLPVAFRFLLFCTLLFPGCCCCGWPCSSTTTTGEYKVRCADEIWTLVGGCLAAPG